MHEYALAIDIARSVRVGAARACGRRIVALDVEIGGLDRLSPEHLAFWLREALGEAVAAKGRIRVLRAPITATCRRCGHRRTVMCYDDQSAALDPLWRRCPQCQSDEGEFDGRAGCSIRSLRFEP